MSPLRESSRQHRYTLFSIQIPYLEDMPGKFPAHFYSFKRAKKAIPANSLPRSIRKPGQENAFSLPTQIPFRELYQRCPCTLNSNPSRKLCRGNSPCPSTLFRELSRQPMYALPTNYYSKVKPDK